MQIKSDARIFSKQMDIISADVLQHYSPTERCDKEKVKETGDTAEKYILQMRVVCARNGMKRYRPYMCVSAG